MTRDAKRAIDTRAVVLPGADRGHLDDLAGREVLLQLTDERLLDGWGSRRDPLGVVEREPFRVAELRVLAPSAVDDGADLAVADAVLAAPGSVEILSEGTADDRADAQVEQVAESRRSLVRP